MLPEERDTDRAALARFADELSAHEYLERILWPDGVRCPHCSGQGRIGKLNGASTRIGAHKCYSCRKTFSVTHGTIFKSSHVPLHKWLQAIYLTEGGTKPMRPHHLQQILNVSFKTASFMMRRLRKAATQHHPEPAAGSTDAAPRSESRLSPWQQDVPGVPRRPSLAIEAR
jgi:transposase-like protein